MTYRQLIEYYGGAARAAESLGLTEQGVRKWGRSKVISTKQIPWQWQCTVAWQTEGDLMPTLGPWEKE